MFVTMMFAENNITVGAFGGWNGFKAKAKENLPDPVKALKLFKMQNTGFFGAEVGYKINMGSFFVTPMISAGFSQKTVKINQDEVFELLAAMGQAVADIKTQIPAASVQDIRKALNPANSPVEISVSDTKELSIETKLRFIPIHALIKAGYNINDKISVYGIAGGGISVIKVNSTTQSRGDVVGGAGVSFKVTDNIAVFAEYRYAYTFMKKVDEFKGIHNNRALGGLQFSF